MRVNNAVSGAVICQKTGKGKEKIHKKGIFRRFRQWEELSKNMKIYSLEHKAFHMNYIG